MNSITHTINGLASSLLLNVGLTSAAEKLDTVARNNSTAVVTVEGALSSEFCATPCNFTAETGQ